MKKSIRKLIVIGLISSSISILPLVGASAEWKQNLDNTWSNTDVSDGWFKDDSNWYFFKNGVMQTGWLKDSNGKYYYLSSNGNMLSNTTTPDGFKVDNNGVWIQNTTINSNNTTNVTSNTDNSTKTTANTTLNNTGVINANTTNNVDVTVDNTSKAENEYYKELKKSEQKSDDSLKAYYQKQLDEARSDLASAQQELSNVKGQLTNKTLTKQSDGTWQYVYVADSQKVAQCEKKVKSCQSNVDYYEKLVK